VADLEHRTLRADEREPFLDLVQAAFGERELFARYLDAQDLVGPDDTLVAVSDGRLAASVQIFDKRIRLGREVVGLGGIGSVATHPDFERRGIATQVLQRAIDEMIRRGHALSLLFTDRISFYERLAWASIPQAAWSIRRSRNAPTSSSSPSRSRSRSRAFEADDLPRIERIYDYYNLHRSGPAVRDRDYWDEQLRYAGNPDEDFRVATRGEKIVAYARCIDFVGIPRVMEYGRAPEGAAELADLLAGWVPETGALVAHRIHDPQLTQALAEHPVIHVDPIPWGDTMWKVLDGDAVARALGDADRLTALFGSEHAVYWASDRF